MKKLYKIIIGMLVVTLVFAACTPAAAEEPVEVVEEAVEEEVEEEVAEPEEVDEEILIAHLPKSIGGAWFTRMYAGFERYAEEHENVTVMQIGASEGDAALQNEAIEDFITLAQGKNAAIAITYVSPEATEQTLKKAMDAGIIVIGNEAPDAVNVDYDIEAFDIPAFGAGIADELAAGMGEEGEYMILVGKLSSSAHMGWANAVRENLEAKYPDIVLVQDPYLEGGYDQQASFEKTMEMIKAYPNLKGFFGTSATDSAGVARAIEESGLEDSTTFITLGTPDLYVDFIKSGAVDLITGWDPSMMGEAMCVLVEKILNGEEIAAGTDLGVIGYDSILLEGKVIKGNAWQSIDVNNVDEVLERDY